MESIHNVIIVNSKEGHCGN